MKIGIMQPYFFPYIGYFQLMNAVDEYIIYDNIEFTKKGWINRNRILVNGRDSYITIPVKKDSDYLDIRDRYVAEVWPAEKKKVLNRIREAYSKASQFDGAYPVVEQCLLSEETNLFRLLLNSLQVVKDYLEIQTPLVVSSTITIDHSLKAEEKVIALCKARKAHTYINPIGGVGLYQKYMFKAESIDLHFLKTGNVIYKQFSNDFVPSLSIIDVLMFNTKSEITALLKNYTLE